jgi:hypothetical protein
MNKLREAKRICLMRNYRFSRIEGAGRNCVVRLVWRHLLLLVLMLLLSESETNLNAQNLIITEFMAANNLGQRDGDGDFSDWIEVYNPDRNLVSLASWFLSDDPQGLTKWQFPDVMIPGQGFVVVFASGKDRRDPTGKLHTNFKLDRNGEYLALTRPDGRTIASEFAPTFPQQISDVSYGPSMLAKTERFVPPGATGRMFMPEDDRLGRTWVRPDFDDANWIPVTMGIGYDRAQAGGIEPPEPAPPLADVTRPGEIIVPTSSNSPANEGVENAIDNNPNTKYLNFDKLNAGLTVTPAAGLSVVTGLHFTSANDAPERDPTSYVLSGSNDGRNFVEISRGRIPNFSSRFVTVEVTFTNRAAYSYYRLLFPTIRNAASAVAVQIAEVEFLGRVGPAPPSFAELIKTNVEVPMFGRRPSVYLRLPFTGQEVHPLERLALRICYDDGFVAYLNGVEIARANAPGNVAFDSVASTNRSRAEAVQEQRHNMSKFATLIHAGANMLAIQGLNDRADSPDFLIQVQLENTELAMGDNGYFETPTPGKENGQANLGLVSDLDLNPKRGFYETPIEVVIFCPTEGATIYYTTNCSAPAVTNGILYAGPIRIERTTAFRAAAFLEGWRSSRVATHTYVFLNDVITQSRSTSLAAGFPPDWNSNAVDYGLDTRVVGPAGKDSYGGKYARTIKSDLQSIPSMSIVMDMGDMFGPQGIYSNPWNRGDAWERAVSLELFHPDNRVCFQEDAGIRIQGGAFRGFNLTLKKSFRVIFREKYGSASLHYPLFGPEAADRFDNIVLRASSNDAWPYFRGSSLYVRDAFAMETALDMGMVASHTTFVHLYINGFYWGLYNPVERPDAAFSATYHGGDKDSWDAINQDSVPNGNYDAWNRMLALLNQGMSNNDVFQRIQGNNPDGTRNPAYEDLLDVENMIDYMILNFYVGNTDWPWRNWWVGRDRNNGDGFHFYPWDTETALGVTGLEVDVTGANTAVARPFAAAKANADFRMRFADRVYRHFFNGGALYVNPSAPSWDPAHPENNRPASRFAALAERVSRAVVGESARWGDQLNTGPFTRDEHWQRERDNLLANYFPRRSAIVLGQLRRAGLYPKTDPPVMNQHGGQAAAGFKLTLNAPQGTIYYTTNGSDPRVPGQVQTVTRMTLVSSNVMKKVLIPSTLNGGDKLGAKWQGGFEPFDDSSWVSGSGAVGFDREMTYFSIIGIDVKAAMDTKNTAAFIRIPFNYDGPVGEHLSFMILRMQYDDGFVAFLNGVKIASTNAPSILQWNSPASASNADAASINFEEFKVDDGLAALKTGRNILAIQGMNATLTSTDFLIGAELIAGQDQPSGGANNATKYTGPIALSDLVTIKARVLNGQEWSALNEATFVVGTPALVLSELLYHPSHPTDAERAAGFGNADDFEFIELFNHGTATCDLNGVRFSTGIYFDFTGSAITSLPPGRYVLVVKDMAAFQRRYGAGLPVAGEYSGQLNNAGEQIIAVNALGETILDFSYGTDAPWPKTADGAGPSLEVVEPKASLNSPANWRASVVNGGSPGAPNPVLLPKIEVIGLADGQLRFRFDERAGSGYTIYVRESLSDGTWQVLKRGESMTQGQPIEVGVDLLTNPPARFFRLSIP